MHEEGQGGLGSGRGRGGKVLQWLTVFVLAFILLRTLQISFQRENYQVIMEIILVTVL